MPRNPDGSSEYDFTLLLDGISQIDAKVENALFEAGCDDATLSAREGRVYLSFSRTAASIKDAILSAIRNVHDAHLGASVIRVDACDLVTQSEIARRIGRSRQLVHQYIAGLRGPGSFPAPACNVIHDNPLWYWREVAHWLWQNDMISVEMVHEAVQIAAINCMLELTHQRRLAPELTQEIAEAIQSISANSNASTI